MLGWDNSICSMKAWNGRTIMIIHPRRHQLTEPRWAPSPSTIQWPATSGMEEERKGKIIGCFAGAIRRAVYGLLLSWSANHGSIDCLIRLSYFCVRWTAARRPRPSSFRDAILPCMRSGFPAVFLEFAIDVSMSY